MVREFRQTVLYPVQLVPMERRGQTSANWERLIALDCVWRDESAELTERDEGFHERQYAEFVAFIPDVQRFLYGAGRKAAGGTGVSSVRVFRRSDVVRATVTLRRGDRPVACDVARVELYYHDGPAHLRSVRDFSMISRRATATTGFGKTGAATTRRRRA